MNLFEHPFNYDLGSLDSTPVERSTFLEENEYENDIYQFDLSQTSNLNISLNNLSTGDDADLYLYQDSNGNGVLDSHDTLLDSSRNGGDSEDSINYEANAGTYFTRVEFYNGGDDGRINYDLDLSAEASSSTDNGATDLFEHPFNYNLGSLDSTPVERSTFLEENEYENDIYQFDLSQTSNLNISLNNLSTGDDADLYLYQDSNGNGVLDSHDTLLDSSRNGGDSEDSINYEANAGTYFTRVEFYNGGDDGRINYDLDLSAEASSSTDNGATDLFEHPFNYNLGSLDSTPVERSTFLEENEYENDIYQFDLSQTSNLNISLNNLSTGDDADLYLYQDSNGNGVLDSHDTLLDSSRNGGDSEDSINYEANAGTYFTRVEFYNGGDDGRINYDLDLSATNNIVYDNEENGGSGNDTLIGSQSRNDVNIDRLTGGAGDDVFILGDYHGNLYKNAGNEDYAHITDFEDGDIIRLDSGTYSLEASPIVGISGTGVYEDGDLLAVIEDVDSSNLSFNPQTFITNIEYSY